jgi:importin-4
VDDTLADTLKATGRWLLSCNNLFDATGKAMLSILGRKHIAQINELDGEEEESDEASETDWAVIDTALNVVVALAVVLGPDFAEYWKPFNDAVTKFASAQEGTHRAAAMGVIAEVANHMGAGISASAPGLIKTVIKRLGDEDPEVRSNAAYAIGQLIFNAQDPAAYAAHFERVLEKLESFLDQEGARLVDNACGAVARLTMKHPDRIPLAAVIGVLLQRLPLKEDMEENRPVYQCLCKLGKFLRRRDCTLFPARVLVFPHSRHPLT